MRAQKFAEEAHGLNNQRYGKYPYRHHLQLVVHEADQNSSLLTIENPYSALVVAWLHDVLEDVPSVTFDELWLIFGMEVATVCRLLTTEGTTRAERHSDLYYQRIASSELATFVKLCDRLANVKACVENNQKLLHRYATEQAYFAKYLKPAFPQFAPMWLALEQLFLQNLTFELTHGK